MRLSGALPRRIDRGKFLGRTVIECESIRSPKTSANIFSQHYRAAVYNGHRGSKAMPNHISA
jgi:hypothetical protein